MVWLDGGGKLDAPGLNIGGGGIDGTVGGPKRLFGGGG